MQCAGRDGSDRIAAAAREMVQADIRWETRSRRRLGRAHRGRGRGGAGREARQRRGRAGEPLTVAPAGTSRVTSRRVRRAPRRRSRSRDEPGAGADAAPPAQSRPGHRIAGAPPRHRGVIGRDDPGAHDDVLLKLGERRHDARGPMRQRAPRATSQSIVAPAATTHALPRLERSRTYVRAERHVRADHCTGVEDGPRADDHTLGEPEVRRRTLRGRPSHPDMLAEHRPVTDRLLHPRSCPRG